MSDSVMDYSNPFDQGPICPAPGAFLCPVCRSDAYHCLVAWTRDGRSKQTSLFQCTGCSVVFGNVKHFTSRRRVVLELTSPLANIYQPVLAKPEEE
jgi:hypothetical protein